MFFVLTYHHRSVHSVRLICSFQTGFEFKKRRAFPVIEGVVIARENESALLEASLFWKRRPRND